MADAQDGVKVELAIRDRPAELVVPYSIFTPRQKAVIITIVSIAATFSSFASNIYFPAIPMIARDLESPPSWST